MTSESSCLCIWNLKNYKLLLKEFLPDICQFLYLNREEMVIILSLVRHFTYLFFSSEATRSLGSVLNKPIALFFNLDMLESSSVIITRKPACPFKTCCFLTFLQQFIQPFYIFQIIYDFDKKYLVCQEKGGGVSRLVISCRSLPDGAIIYKTGVYIFKFKPAALTSNHLWLVLLGYEDGYFNVTGYKF